MEIWSDVVCPWCYIDKRRFEAALADFEHADEVELVWRSFELDPGAPRTQETSSLEHLVEKYGMSPGQARAAQARVSELAQAEGLDYRLEAGTPRKLLRRAPPAAARACARPAGRAEGAADGGLLQRGLSPIGEPEVLARLGVEAGLEPGEVAATLAGDGFAHGEVQEPDERRAEALGIRAVPFFVLDERFGIEGAQPAASILAGLRQAAAAGPQGLGGAFRGARHGRARHGPPAAAGSDPARVERRLR